MTEEKTCYNCGNKNCHIFYATVKQDDAEHHETYEYTGFDCVNHDKWKELKVEEIRTDNTETRKNAKKMTKDEIKNRISMALTNPVLQQGFEIICKQNIELGKHNEELIALINAERGRQEKCDDVHLRKIAELEKENAELKSKLEALDGDTPWKDIKDKSELIGNLAKAKKIIKELIDFDFLPDVDIKKQAEQFLKETDK